MYSNPELKSAVKRKLEKRAFKWLGRMAQRKAAGEPGLLQRAKGAISSAWQKAPTVDPRKRYSQGMQEVQQQQLAKQRLRGVPGEKGPTPLQQEWRALDPDKQKYQREILRRKWAQQYSQNPNNPWLNRAPASSSMPQAQGGMGFGNMANLAMPAMMVAPMLMGGGQQQQPQVYYG
jgi:hypothetical protein